MEKDFSESSFFRIITSSEKQIETRHSGSWSELESLWIKNNPALTKAQIDELQKALRIRIISNPKK